ncbi:MAG TPA: glycosyltransferase family 39 protein [Acidimicrobiales bacterium]|nr:glycosyltransferase family 39 protein [Acidimicrobiales bacterium]
MAQAILHGHFITFFWGQQYGGTESYVVAALFELFGRSPVVLKLAPTVMAAVAAVLVWRIACHLVASRSLAVLAGVLVWVAPASSVASSTMELGFRGVTLAAGLGCLLASLRVLDGSTRWRDFVALGLLAGVAWWSSPESVYILLPAVLVLVGAAVQGFPRAALCWALRLGATVVSAAVGALPWLWANVNSGFASLRPDSFGGTGSVSNPGYAGRLALFLRFTVPMQLDLRVPWWGRWVIGGPRASVSGQGALLALCVLVSLVLATCVVLCALRGGRCLALLVALAAFPFLYASNPGTWFWQDGRYAIYLGPLLALLLTTGLGELGIRVSALSGRVAPIGSVTEAGPARVVELPLGLALAGGSAALTAAAFAGPMAATGPLGGLVEVEPVVAPDTPADDWDPRLLATATTVGAQEPATSLADSSTGPLAPRPRRLRLADRLTDRLSGAGVLAMAVAVAGAAVLSALGIGLPYGLTYARFVAGWSDPNVAVVQVADHLARLGIDDAYAGYWIAYKLDFEGDGRVTIATVPPDLQPRPAYAKAVSRTPRAAWLFVPASRAAEGIFEFGSTSGPSGYDETTFERALDDHHIAYRVVDAGLLQAVVPAARVTTADLQSPS